MRETRAVFPAAMMLIAAIVFGTSATAPTAFAEDEFSLLPPTSQPSAKPTTQPITQIQKWFDDLADTDQSVRDAARVGLMGLPRQQLDVLRDLIVKNRPLAPSQVFALREVVMQVYLTGELYAQNPAGFLGVSLNDFHQHPASQVPPDPADPAIAMAGDCVIVTERKPGFCGYQYLQDNDLVLGVIGQEFQLTQSMDDLRGRVQQTGPGELITLQIMRNGKVIRVAFNVSGQPSGVQNMLEMQNFFNDRLEKARDFWEKNFATLMTGKLS